MTLRLPAALSLVVGLAAPVAGQQIAIGIGAQTCGVVRVDGAAVRGPSPDRGTVFQQYSLSAWMTVRQTVEVGLNMKGIGAATERQRAPRTLLSLAGVLAFEDRYPDPLSGGMKQRVGIVRALATGPHVLLLDEPYGALDSQTRAIMQSILLELWEASSISVLFVTHDIDEAIFLSDRIHVMTARPDRINVEITIDVPRSCRTEVVAERPLLALREMLRGLIREESLRAMGPEVSSGTADPHFGQDLVVVTA